MIVNEIYRIKKSIRNVKPPCMWQYFNNKITNRFAGIKKLSGLSGTFTVILLILSLNSSFSQEITDNYNRYEINISPRITIGYTFGGGVNCGFDISSSVYKYNDIMLGVHISYYLVFVKKGGIHRIRGLLLSAETQYLSGRIGFGGVRRSWGLRNVNRAGAKGLMVDIAAGVDEYKAPWLGLKSFIFNRSKWKYYKLPAYTSTYIYFKSENIDVYKQPPPPVIEEDDEE